MNFLRKLFRKEQPAEHLPSSSTAEDIIATLRQRSAAMSMCWIVCYEDRPLQGAPPGSSKPHLLIFTSTAQAEAFIAGRRSFFMPEPLSVVGVDSASRLKELAIAPSRDPRYESPPCGLLLNFTYPTGATDGTLTPQQIAEMDANQLARDLGLKRKEKLFKDQEEIDPNKCMICHKELNFERKVGGILFGDQLFELAERTAYKCRKCGAPICMSCARTNRCRKCGGNVFDRAIG